MISFRKFLFESQFIDIGNTGYYEHKHEINGHKIHMHFDHVVNGVYHVHFAVNNRYNPHSAHEQDAGKIMHHVHNTILNFVHEKKPTKLMLKGASGYHDRAYAKYANVLSKKLGWSPDRILLRQSKP